MSQRTDAVLITGGSKRLGLQFTLKTLELGFSAVVHYHHDISDVLKTISSKESQNRIYFIQHDLSEQPELILDKALNLPINLIGLINNASIFTEGNLNDIDDLKKIIWINALVPAQINTCFAKKVKKGWIINITDAIIEKPNSRFQNYRISKLLLQQLTRQQAYLFAPNLRVNALAPGAMIPASTEDQDYFNSLSKIIPMHTTGDLHSLMNAYEFLINSPYVTGETIRVDGGWNIVS
jgi:NAD(P)-dependent dehydrogenase (short-subunit alcohol dehydrogenase family)